MKNFWYVFCSLLFTAKNINGCEDVEMVPRSAWGAREPKARTIMKLPVPHAFIYHTVTENCWDIPSCSGILRAIQTMHMDSNGWSDIGYSFLVGGDGRMYEGRGWNLVEAACPNYNNISIGIAFIGNFMDQAPNVSMVISAYNLIGYGAEKGYFTENYQTHGHRDATCTASPGTVLYAIIQKWPRFVGGPLPHYSCVI